MEAVAVALRAQLVVAEVALRREVENGERKDAGQTKSWLRSPCAYSTSFNLAVVWLLPTVGSGQKKNGSANSQSPCGRIRGQGR